MKQKACRWLAGFSVGIACITSHVIICTCCQNYRNLPRRMVALALKLLPASFCGDKSRFRVAASFSGRVASVSRRPDRAFQVRVGASKRACLHEPTSPICVPITHTVVHIGWANRCWSKLSNRCKHRDSHNVLLDILYIAIMTNVVNGGVSWLWLTWLKSLYIIELRLN